MRRRNQGKTIQPNIGVDIDNIWLQYNPCFMVTPLRTKDIFNI